MKHYAVLYCVMLLKYYILIVLAFPTTKDQTQMFKEDNNPWKDFKLLLWSITVRSGWQVEHLFQGQPFYLFPPILHLPSGRSKQCFPPSCAGTARETSVQI